MKMVRATSPSLISICDDRLAQLGDTFLSSKHQDYLAAIAEFISGKRAV